MKLSILLLPLLLFGCIALSPPLIYSWFSLTITLVILLMVNIFHIIVKKVNNKGYYFFKMTIVSLILMPFLSYIVSSFFYNATKHCNEVLTMSKMQCNAQMEELAISIKLFKLDNGTYPTTKEGLEALIKNPNPEKYPKYSPTPYIEDLPMDNWRNPFKYNRYIIEEKEKFEIISFGNDGKYGGEYRDIVYPDCSVKKVGFFEPFN